MADTIHLNLPVTEADVRRLRVGDQVTLSGKIIISAGLPTYRRLLAELRDGMAPPFDPSDATLFHVGSQSRETGGRYELLYISPTTSTRFDPEMPELIRGLNLRMVGGKGGLGPESVKAMEEVGCVYLSFLGGGCTLLSDAIREVIDVHWTEMIEHFRIVEVMVERLGPLGVGIDSHGNSIYQDVRSAAEQKLPGILDNLSHGTVTR